MPPRSFRGLAVGPLRLLLLAPAFALCVAPAGAQEPEAPVGEAPEILILAPRSESARRASPAKRTVVPGEELRRTGERSLPRALGRAAGIWIQESNLGGGAPVIRGLLGNQVLILLDGVRLNDATTRFGPNQSLATIDPAIVDRVEIVRGAGSLLYGSDAIGGVIAIWTRRRAPGGAGGAAPPAGTLRGTWDSATDGGGGSLDAAAAGERWGALGVASGASWDDLEAGGGEVQEATGYSSGAGFGSLDWDFGEGRGLRLTAMQHRDFDVPRTFQVVPGYGQTQASFARYDFALQEREQAQLTWDDRSGGGFADRMQLRAFAKQYREQRITRRTGSSTESFGETDVKTLGLGADWSRETATGHRWTWGVDLSDDRVDSWTLRTDLGTGAVSAANGEFAPDARYTSLGAFALDEIPLDAADVLTLGARLSWYDFSFDDFGAGRESGNFGDLTVGAEWSRRLSESVGLTAALAQGFQAPNLEDLANDGDFAGGVELANPDLDPAQSWSAELALDVTRPRWTGSAAAFFTRIEDVIGRRLLDAGIPAVAGDELYQRVNAGRLDLWGLEAVGGLALGGAGSPWSLQGAASWVRGRQHDGTIDPNTGAAPLDGVEARRIPPLNGRFSLDWRGDPRARRLLEDARLSLSWAAKQDRLHPEDRSDPRIDPDGTAGWTSWDLEFGGPLGAGARWNLALVNLLDENYRVHSSAIDAPGRSLIATVEIPL